MKKLDELAQEIIGNAQAISDALDGLEPAQAEKFKETTFYKLALNTLGKVSIYSDDYAYEILNYFEALIVHLLPLRLHDSSYVSFVTDELFHNGNESRKRHWLYDELCRKLETG